LKRFLAVIIISLFFLNGCGSDAPLKEYTYPFSKASKIEVVSYPGRMNWDDIDEEIVKDGVLTINDKIKERKVFTKAQTDSLFNFLFIDECPVFNSKSKCFDPRHAILFYDKKGKVIGHIEICLECGTSQQSFSFNAICDERTKQLADIFKQAGIKYFGEGE
jgi:hypothetical protein